MDKIIKELNKLNDIEILPITDQSFTSFGRVLDSKHFSDAIEYLCNRTDVPKSGNHYLAHDPELEESILAKDVYTDIFGGIKLQYGYVNGHNQLLNSLEYHKSSEINIAASSFIVMVGHTKDIEMLKYKTNNVKAYYVPKGTVIEFYPFTLHFSPCEVSEFGFKCGVILPYHTNVDFVKAAVLNKNEDQLLFKTNKWILSHNEHARFIDLGVVGRLEGINYKIRY